MLKANPQKGELKTQMPPHLMHAKTLLFDLDENYAELWIGSHNWTARALTGLNIEVSIVISMNTASDLYRVAQDLLNYIRDSDSSVPFDPNLVDYYKWLQGQKIEEVDWIVDLFSYNADRLTGERITLFMILDKDYQSLKKVDKDIKLFVEDRSSGRIFLYDARIRDTGYVERSGLDYGDRLYAFHSGSVKPMIEGPAAPPTTGVKKSKYWATWSRFYSLEYIRP